MPDNILDIFNQDAFSTLEMTAAINLVPNMYGRLNQLNLFPAKPVSTTDVAIEMRAGTLNLVPSTLRGAPGTPNLRATRSVRKFTVPHLALDDSIKADEIQNVRAFGSSSRLLGVMEKVAEVQDEMARKLFITLEFLRNGALAGAVLDANGDTILDLFSEFGVSQKTENFKLATEGEKIVTHINAVKRHIAQNLLGDMMTNIRALCSPGFWDAFITQADVEQAYKLYQGGANPLRDDVRAGFPFQGVIWEEYLGQATTADGTTKVFIPANSALFFPEGTTATFATYFAPADYMETVNTPGLPIYSKLGRRDTYDKAQPIEAQSNPLPICMRPAVLVKGTKA
ncbi:MAG: major capsid protein [Desulfarculus sp.]|jgi:hypothetical protein|nr:MAG: major capsid protein [Desulfarculus sp.]